MTARSVPTLPSWLTLGGTVVTQSEMQQLNTYMQFFSSPPMFRMYQTIAQSVANTTWSQITCDTSEWDTDTGRAGSTPWSYTIPAGMAGRWQFTGLYASAPNSAGARVGALYQNGSPAPAAQIPGIGTASVNGGSLVPVTIACNAGDVMSLWGWQSTGSALNSAVSGQQSYLEGRLVSLASP